LVLLLRAGKGEIELLVITTVPITPLNVSAFKTVRLRALQDTPLAFGATYANESQLTDAEWLQRTQRWNGEPGIGFFAMDGDAACGIAGSFLEPDDPACAKLISMWVPPTHRQRGVGRRLVNEVVRWAGSRNARTLLLLVTSNNEPAIRFYECLGFTRTGHAQPYPNDPAILKYEMSRAIS